VGLSGRVTRLVIRRAFKFAALPATTYHLCRSAALGDHLGRGAVDGRARWSRDRVDHVTGSTSTWVMALNTLYYAELYVTPESTTGAA
jgi:hypothetical protein